MQAIARRMPASQGKDSIVSYLGRQYSEHPDSALALLMKAAYSHDTDMGGRYELNAEGNLAPIQKY